MKMVICRRNEEKEKEVEETKAGKEEQAKDSKEGIEKAKDKAGSVMKRRTFGEKAKTKDIDGCEEESEGQRC